MPHAYPIILDVSDRLAVIVGGGQVAARKARGLVAAGAKRVRMVAPQLAGDLPDGIERVMESYKSEHLRDASLVFAATDDVAINDAVVRDAHAIGALVCRADASEDESGDFTVPAVHRAGPVTVAVATEGAPALASLVRDHFAERFDETWRQLAESMQRLRPQIQAKVADPMRRQQIFRDLSSPEAIRILRNDGADALRRWAESRHPDFPR